MEHGLSTVNKFAGDTNLSGIPDTLEDRIWIKIDFNKLGKWSKGSSQLKFSKDKYNILYIGWKKKNTWTNTDWRTTGQAAILNKETWKL